MKRAVIPLFAVILSFLVFSCKDHGKLKDPTSLFDVNKFHQAYLRAPNTSNEDYFEFVSVSGTTVVA
jgi:hypothetical protein